MTPDSGIFEGISWSVSRLPCALKIGAGLVECRGGAALMLARIRARIEAAAPFPLRAVVRVAGALGDRAGVDVAVIDQPAFLASVMVAAAGQGGHGRSFVRLACGRDA
jgi:hypothetical protein